MLFEGQILRDRFRVIRQIGKGGTSRVYLAEDISIGKKWAVKFIDTSDDDTGWLAQNEINMMIRLDYEMFPRIVDAWQEREGYIIVSDFVDGVTLNRYLAEQAVSKNKLLDWWIEIAKALDYLHTLNPAILYLDLKLENVMIKKDGSLKMIDFGIAGRIAEKGSLYGTIGYAAPEQYYNRGELLDERTDVFAFGMLMYAMYTGKRPVKNLKDQTILLESNKKINKNVKNIIRKCIMRNKEDRFESMDEIISELYELKNKRSGIRQIKVIAASLIAGVFLMGFTAVKSVVAEPTDNPSVKLAEELSGHISEGEYTEEGIKIIESYIDAGCLDEDSKYSCIYQVAKFYFENKKNYREAMRYFKQLDEVKYPDVVYYKELCNIQLNFETDSNDYIKCLDDFVSYNKGIGYSETRFENDLMIAALYEGICSLNKESQDKTIELLQTGINELRFAINNNLFVDPDGKYEGEYCRRLCILLSDNNQMEDSIRYGEKAIEILSDNAIRNDIEQRILKMKDNY